MHCEGLIFDITVLFIVIFAAFIDIRYLHGSCHLADLSSGVD